ncbi:type VI immunity family protein [Pseudomonas xantholysinigenes]|uniref:DUF3396 domain-containing protein n=1 Tax=Pseudomonas xantholysinigenes TaxID=2745490 RepID=A0A9E6PVH6_9PSED|nr:type VI immunity family protein [Pseudomonas xantholysinigenes]QXI37488.1 DUF3396 domain-containing protein [Pseudomonas xantholysinigenes]
MHDYSAQTAKATLVYLAGDGVAEPLAFRWAFVKGFGAVPSYMIDGYSPAGWMEDIHGTLTPLRFYLPVEEILDGRKTHFEGLFKEMCSLLEPLHAAAGLGIQHTYQWEDFQHIEFELATAYQGLDIARPRAHPGWRLGYSNLNWYTYINSAWMRKLGSVRKALVLGDAALKTASECSFTTRKVVRDSDRSSAVFALPDLRLKTFHTEPR